MEVARFGAILSRAVPAVAFVRFGVAFFIALSAAPWLWGVFRNAAARPRKQRFCVAIMYIQRPNATDRLRGGCLSRIREPESFPGVAPPTNQTHWNQL